MICLFKQNNKEKDEEANNLYFKISFSCWEGATEKKKSIILLD